MQGSRVNRGLKSLVLAFIGSIKNQAFDLHIPTKKIFQVNGLNSILEEDQQFGVIVIGWLIIHLTLATEERKKKKRRVGRKKEEEDY